MNNSLYQKTWVSRLKELIECQYKEYSPHHDNISEHQGWIEVSKVKEKVISK